MIWTSTDIIATMPSKTKSDQKTAHCDYRAEQEVTCEPIFVIFLGVHYCIGVGFITVYLDKGL